MGWFKLGMSVILALIALFGMVISSGLKESLKKIFKADGSESNSSELQELETINILW